MIAVTIAAVSGSLVMSWTKLWSIFSVSMGKRLRYVAGEKDPLYLHALRNRFLRTPSVTVCELDPERPEAYAEWQGQFESALCVNVLESVAEPKQVLASLRSCLKPGGTLLVLVPQGKGLFGSLDHGMGHQRRFEASELGQMLADTGFSVLEEKQLNKFGALSWWLFGKVMGRTKMNRVMLKLWDKTVWFWRRIDGILPGRGLSLVMVARAK